MCCSITVRVKVGYPFVMKTTNILASDAFIPPTIAYSLLVLRMARHPALWRHWICASGLLLLLQVTLILHGLLVRHAVRLLRHASGRHTGPTSYLRMRIVLR